MSKKRFNLYDAFVNKTSATGADTSIADMPKNVGNYFRILWYNFSRLFSVNVIYVLGNFPIFFLLFALSGFVSLRGLSPQSTMFGNLIGAMDYSGYNPVAAAMFGTHGVQVDVNVPGTAVYVLTALTFLLVFTFGYINAGITLSLRDIMKGEPVYFFENIKAKAPFSPECGRWHWQKLLRRLR